MFNSAGYAGFWGLLALKQQFSNYATLPPGFGQFVGGRPIRIFQKLFDNFTGYRLVRQVTFGKNGAAAADKVVYSSVRIRH